MESINVQINLADSFQKKTKLDTKYMKKCSTSLTIKEIHFKTSLEFCLIPVRIDHIKQNKKQILVKMWGKGTLIHYWWEFKLVQSL
jgi:tRNA U34 5-methylaminomethyl-2-thiouridine-forming methyltransferase MnmC